MLQRPGLAAPAAAAALILAALANPLAAAMLDAPAIRVPRGSDANANARFGAAGDPYIAAADAAQVPLNLLVAVAGAESGYHPWALNLAGREIYCRTRAEAERLLEKNDKVDIGLMQINWKYWGPRLKTTKSQLLDPRTNLVFGARILKECLERGGDIWRRISDYHAGSQSTRDRYNRRVYSSYLRYLHGETK